MDTDAAATGNNEGKEGKRQDNNTGDRQNDTTNRSKNANAVLAILAGLDPTALQNVMAAMASRTGGQERTAHPRYKQRDGN